MKALALDGGGIRGYLSVLILERLEAELLETDGVDPASLDHSYLLDKFDLFTGTSTGAILAAGIVSGKKLHEIRKLYEELGPAIFVSGFGRARTLIRNVIRFGPSAPKYHDDDLGKFLKRQFHDADGKDLRLGDLPKSTCIQVYDATLNEPVVFKSDSNSARSRHNADLPLWEVVKASASAPTFFPAHILRCHAANALSKSWYESVDSATDPRQSTKHAMIDGGVFANNPAAVATAEMAARIRGSDAGAHPLIVSVGTGEQPTEAISARKGRNAGKAQWALPLVSIFMSGVSKHTHNLVDRVVGDRYFRFEIILEKDFPMDTGKSEDFERMSRTAEAYLADFSHDSKRANRHRVEGYLFSSQMDALRPMI